MSTDLARITQCRSCRKSNLVDVLDLGRSPLANALVPPDTPEPDPSYPLQLVTCPDCGLFQLAHTAPAEAMFNEEYAYFTSFMQSMVDNARVLVERVVAERGLGADDLAVEVASNDGYLLQHYLAAGVPALGIDPAENTAEAAAEKGVETIVDFFGVELAQRVRSERGAASVIHANNVLAHIPDLNDFVSGFRELLADDGRVHVEVAYQREMVDLLEFDTTYHEHVCYYSLTALDGLFSQNGLEIVDVELLPVHGTSLRVTAAHPGVTAASDRLVELRAEEERIGLATPAYVADFGDRVRRLCETLRTLLEHLRAGGATVAAYGAAAKATTLLNAIGANSDLVEFVADRSTVKQGRMIPGVRIPIVPPEELVSRQPDYALILAWNVADEIMAQQAEYAAAGGRFIVPVPFPSIR